MKVGGVIPNKGPDIVLPTFIPPFEASYAKIIFSQVSINRGQIALLSFGLCDERRGTDSCWYLL